MNIKPIRLFELMQEKTETIKDIFSGIKNKVTKASISFYWVYVLYTVTTIFLIKLAQIIL